MGYDDVSKAYKVFNPPNQKIMIKEDVVFNKSTPKVFAFKERKLDFTIEGLVFLSLESSQDEPHIASKI
jgi:hypothetical protein